MKSFLSLRPLKQKNIGYCSREEGEVPFFLTGNYFLRKTFKKCDNVVEISVVGFKPSLCKSIKICPFFKNLYIFWKRKCRCIFLCKKPNLDIFQKIGFLRGGGLKC
jgi:hypothetical protein